MLKKLSLLNSAARFMLSFAACIFLVYSAAGQTGISIQVRVSGSHHTYTCPGEGVDSVQVTGSGNVLTITGDCGSLQVTGAGNNITIDSVKSLNFTGSNNSVLYKRGPRPTLSDDAQNNTLARAKGQASSAPGDAASTGSAPGGEDTSATAGTSVDAIVASAKQTADAASRTAAATAGTVNSIQVQGNVLNLQLSNRHTTQDCADGRSVNINGYKNEITLTGSCSKVTLNGWGNTIRLEEVAAIEVLGHDNTFLWKRGRNAPKPAVQIDSGEDNAVRHWTAATQ